jgi:hypothetical protein
MENAAGVGPFVLNLCSSSTPMALGQAQIPELKQFSFFVSRRLEEGRERFRLHMGYFPTLAEAQEWLNVVRDIYPGAWAGEAPGKKLRERAASAQAQQATAHVAAPPAPVPQQVSRAPQTSTVQRQAPARASVAAAATAAITQAQVAARAAARPAVHVPTAHPAPPPVLNVPTLQAATMPPANIPVARAAQPQPSRAPAAPAVTRPVATRSPSAPAATPAARAAAPRIPAPKSSAARVPAPQVGRASVPPAARVGAPPARLGAALAARPGTTAAARAGAPAPRPAASAGAARPAGRVGAAKSKSVIGSSNVKEVLAALDETTGETRMMPAPAMPPEMRNVGPSASAGSAVHANVSRASAIPADDSSLSDTQVLRFLETRRSDSGERPTDADTGISLLKPDDTGTRRALKTAVVQNAPVSFAVQLQWSVQPVELDKVPPLAIFSAYTLYTVEGSRDGRRWYGLRLGFFSDAISAKQVAYYVRSEFASVAVVPVSPQERERATDDGKSASLSQPKKLRSQPVDEFKLIDVDEQPESPRAAAAPRSTAAPAKKPAARGAAPQAASSRRGGRVRAREQRSPQTLEETLEILGASQLEIDTGNGESLNDTGVRHLRVEVQKNTPFRRLIERLSERVKKN